MLGTLAARERDAFERALASDPSLRAAVRAWEARLAPLSDGVPAITPDPRTWSALVARLAPRSGPAASPQEGGQEGGTGRVVRLERAVRRWRAATAGAGALAAALALVIAGGAVLRAPADAPGYLAVVNRGGELPALVVRVDPRAGVVQVRSLAAETPADRSLQLWYIAPGAAPRSLGVLDPSATRLPIPAALRGPEAGGATLAVSVEPRGGSPAAGPTGPVVYSGRLVRE